MKNRLNDKITKHYERTSRLRTEIINGITNVLKKMNGCIDFSECPFCVSYDGGNHPEQSTVFAIAESIESYGDTSFHLNMDCAQDVDSSRFSFDDIVAIYDNVMAAWNDIGTDME